MQCPRCQQENPAHARFCLGCGARLALACGACGTELPGGARFCLQCEVQHEIGDSLTAIPTLERCVDLMRDDLLDERAGLGLPVSLGAMVWLAFSLAEVGRSRDAVTWADRELNRAEALAHPYSLLHGLWAVAAVQLGLGEHTRVLEAIGRLRLDADLRRDLGYVDGHSITVQYRAAAGNLDLLPDLAAELVDLKVALIVVTGFQAVQATKQATRTVPIVMVAGVDPVATGLVASLVRPGGTITGLTLNHPETGGKRLELLRAVSPRVSRIAVLSNRDNPATAAEWRSRRQRALWE